MARSANRLRQSATTRPRRSSIQAKNELIPADLFLPTNRQLELFRKPRIGTWTELLNFVATRLISCWQSMCLCRRMTIPVANRANTQNVSFTSLYSDDNLFYQHWADITKCLYLLGNTIIFLKTFYLSSKYFQVYSRIHKTCDHWYNNLIFVWFKINFEDFSFKSFSTSFPLISNKLISSLLRKYCTKSK